jgi:hypothetical protein
MEIVENLKNGQYFFFDNIGSNLSLCRIIEEDIVFFNSAIGVPAEPKEAYNHDRVMPLTYQNAIIKLLEICAKKNKPVPPLPKERLPIEQLNTNQFFLVENTIGFIYKEGNVCYFNSYSIRNESTNYLSLVIPISIHQAALLLAQNEL